MPFLSPNQQCQGTKTSLQYLLQYYLTVNLLLPYEYAVWHLTTVRLSLAARWPCSFYTDSVHLPAPGAGIPLAVNAPSTAAPTHLILYALAQSVNMMHTSRN